MLRLELINVSKQYPAVRANDKVNLRVKPGEIHAVLGENGAGKSTMMKMIYGAVRPDEGEIRWNGQAVQIASPAQARQLGVSSTSIASVLNAAISGTVLTQVRDDIYLVNAVVRGRPFEEALEATVGWYLDHRSWWEPLVGQVRNR